MHYLGKPGPHHSKRGGAVRGGWKKSLPADLILLTFFLFPPLPPCSSERWTALYPVSTGPRSQIRELLMELSLVLVYLVPSHQVQVSSSPLFFTDGHREKGLWVIHTAPGNNKTISGLPAQTPYFSYLGNFQTAVFREEEIAWICYDAHPESPGLRLTVQRDLS